MLLSGLLKAYDNGQPGGGLLVSRNYVAFSLTLRALNPSRLLTGGTRHSHSHRTIAVTYLAAALTIRALYVAVASTARANLLISQHTSP